MEKWRNFLLQKMGEDENGTPYAVHESVETWGVWCKDIPFRPVSKVKEPARRTWHDEHGDDEYISVDGLYMESYEMKVEFGCKKMDKIEADGATISAITDVRSKVAAFISYLRESGMMKMYSTYTRTGRQSVRFVSYEDSAKWVSEDNQEFLIFSISFKVNDPVTEVTGAEIGL